MWNSHDVNYVNKCKSDVAAELTGRLGWNFAWPFLMVYICYLQIIEPLEENLENCDEMGYLMGTKTLNGHNFWTNKDIDMGFSGLLLWRSRLLNKGESNIHTSITFIPILMSYCWMGPKPLEICKLIPSHNTPRYLKIHCRCSVPLSPSFHVHWWVHVWWGPVASECL